MLFTFWKILSCAQEGGRASREHFCGTYATFSVGNLYSPWRGHSKLEMKHLVSNLSSSIWVEFQYEFYSRFERSVRYESSISFILGHKKGMIMLILLVCVDLHQWDIFSPKHFHFLARLRAGSVTDGLFVGSKILPDILFQRILRECVEISVTNAMLLPF